MVIKFMNGKIKIIDNLEMSEPNSHASERVQTTSKERMPVKSKSEVNKVYYDNHKDSYYSCQVECECGCLVTKVHMNRHKQTQKHKILIDNLSI